MFKTGSRGSCVPGISIRSTRGRIDQAGDSSAEAEVSACGRASASARMGALRTPSRRASSFRCRRHFTRHDVQRYFAARIPKGSASRRRGIRAAVRIFLDIDDDGRFSRRARRPTTGNQCAVRAGRAQPIWTSCENIEAYRQGRSASGLSSSSLFTDYLERIGVSTWKDVQPSALRTFLVTRVDRHQARDPVVLCEYLSRLPPLGLPVRRLGSRLSAAAASVRQYRLAGIPDLLTDDEVAALSPGGRPKHRAGQARLRDLAAGGKLRHAPGDIRQLSLDHIDWRGRQIALPQAKTGRLLTLPLLPEVQDALIDYLREGRPQTEFRNVFVRHLAPYEPFAAKNNLPTIFREALRRAGLDQRKGRKGLYLLRHTLASRLLRTWQLDQDHRRCFGPRSSELDARVHQGRSHQPRNRRPVHRGAAPMTTTPFTSPLKERTGTLPPIQACGRLPLSSRGGRPSLPGSIPGQTPRGQGPGDHVGRGACVCPGGAVLEHNAPNRLTLIRELCRYLAVEDARTAIPPRNFLGIRRSPLSPTHSDSRRGKALPGGVRDLSPSPLFSTPRRGPRYRSDASLRDRPAAWAKRCVSPSRMSICRAGLLHVRLTKFGKSRLVPISADLIERLRTVPQSVEQTSRTSRPGNALFFVGPRGKPVSARHLACFIPRHPENGPASRKSGARRPRVHDLRGTFAVHRLLRWYEQDADLEAKLPLLVTYLGHVSIHGSQRYLQLARDLLGEVTRRHQACFGHLITDELEATEHENN